MTRNAPTPELMAERLAIGAVLLQPEQFALMDLAADDFSLPLCRQAWKAITETVVAGETPDPVTLAQRLANPGGMNSGQWMAHLGAMARECVSPERAPTYARTVRTHARTRQLARIARELLEAAQRGEDTADSAVEQIMALDRQTTRHSCSLKLALSEAVDEIDAAFHAQGSLRGLPTGLSRLDDITGGLHNGDLIVLAARPAMGKTALMLNMALATGAPAGIISSEQPRHQVAMRLIAIEGKVIAARMRNGHLEDDDWPKITGAVSRLPVDHMHINDHAGITITELARQARAWHHQHGIRALFVDYIQRIRAEDISLPRHEQVAQVVMTLKQIARDLDIPVVALAQVNRGVESRPNKRPTMGDIKDSGAIEQEADVILTLYRDEVYHEDTPERGVAEIAVAKNRHGPVCALRASWLGWCMRFEEAAGAPQRQQGHRSFADRYGRGKGKEHCDAAV